MTPRKEPVPSASAPQPKGILKASRPAPRSTDSQYVPWADRSLHWDEDSLEHNQTDLDNTPARMVIDEPKTPFVRNAVVDPVEDDGFALDAPDEPRSSDTAANTLANTRPEAHQRNLDAMLASAKDTQVPRAPLADIDLEKLGDDGEPLDEVRHAAFALKRHQLYGNEGAALKRHAADLPDDDEMEP